MEPRAFTTSVPVVFGDMDAARMLYFPRLFHFAHRVMEDWFAAKMSVNYARFLDELKLGLPTVHAEADYASPIRYGEVLQCDFTVTALGRTSISLRFRFRSGDAPRAEARTTVVCVDMGTFSKLPIPADLRAALSAHLESGPA